MNVTVPTLLVDVSVCSSNISRMLSKAEANDLALRPHFKTHQSEKIGDLFREKGITQITVSSFRMAEYFAQQGWDDITVAFPANILEIDRINQLAKQIKLNLVVESAEVIDFLDLHLQNPVSTFIKIDTGYHRTGIESHQSETISHLIKALIRSKNLRFVGFLSHGGHTYSAANEKEIAAIHFSNLKQLNHVKQQFQSQFPKLVISTGDTPSCSTMERFDGVDEIRPGNFVYYDAMQLFLGSCRLEQIAVKMACPVVAVHKERMEVVIYGGAVHFSKESMIHPVYGTCYGLVLQSNGTHSQLSEGSFLKKLSQEHGIVQVTPDFISTMGPGSIIEIIPVHSCLTADLMKNDTVFY